MPAYVVIDIDVHDPDPFEAYKSLGPPAIAAYGGRYLARGGRTETLEGDWSPKRLVILEFDSVERAQEWWASPEYAEAKALRQRCSSVRMVVVEGLAQTGTPR
jgi:uncharacterized protein (DUF1330 family)